MGLLGLSIGSFITVVVARFSNFLSLWSPRSQCPCCYRPIAWKDNIPLLSYVYLRARCRSCQGPISLEYPLTELSALILTLLTAWHFGPSWAGFFACVLTWFLLALSLIDIHQQILPDEMTLPLLWLGLGLNTRYLFTSPEQAILGAICGYGLLWLLYWLFKIITKKEGMGYGDFKLLACFGAWFGLFAIPPILLTASVLGSLVGLSLLLLKKINRAHPIPFGPFLAGSAWLYLLGFLT